MLRPVCRDFASLMICAKKNAFIEEQNCPGKTGSKQLGGGISFCWDNFSYLKTLDLFTWTVPAMYTCV